MTPLERMMKMEIPVSGFMYSSGSLDSNGEHTHQLYLTSWNRQPVHVHEFSGVTSVNVGHRHDYVGTTEPAPSGVEHTHEYMTITSVDAGHRHEIRGITGPGVRIPGGGHFHYFEGVTSVNGDTPHRHAYRGNTEGAIDV